MQTKRFIAPLQFRKNLGRNRVWKKPLHKLMLMYPRETDAGRVFWRLNDVCEAADHCPKTRSHLMLWNMAMAAYNPAGLDEIIARHRAGQLTEPIKQEAWKGTKDKMRPTGQVIRLAVRQLCQEFARQFRKQAKPLPGAPPPPDLSAAAVVRCIVHKTKTKKEDAMLRYM